MRLLTAGSLVRVQLGEPRRSKLCIACSDFFQKSERAHVAAPPFQTGPAAAGLRFGFSVVLQSPLCSGLFFCLRLQNKPSARASAPPLRKRSRSARLLGCKRPRDGSLSLPTFCGFESDTQRWDGISFTADLRVGAKSLCSGLFLPSENAYFPPAPLLRSPNESTTTRSINVKKRRSPRYYSMSV